MKILKILWIFLGLKMEEVGGSLVSIWEFNIDVCKFYWEIIVEEPLFLFFNIICLLAIAGLIVGIFSSTIGGFLLLIFTGVCGCGAIYFLIKLICIIKNQVISNWRKAEKLYEQKRVKMAGIIFQNFKKELKD